MDCDETVASGYFGGRTEEVAIGKSVFNGADARALRECGTRGLVERNDSTGPDDYREGECMPGLTPEGVLDEITSED